MNYNPNIHHRRSIRLPDHDYSQNGAYFITLCTHNRHCLFGNIVGATRRSPSYSMFLNPFGEIVRDEWLKSAEIRSEIELDEFVIMPNHIHAIAFLHTSLHKQTTSASPFLNPNGPKSKSVGAWIAGFKSAATKRINIIRNAPRSPVWQRNYYEHIIRDEPSLHQIRDYIRNNPECWQQDKLYINSAPTSW